jgi:hypothetical protein
MTQAAIAGQIHQTLDVHRGFAAKIALNRMITIDRFADLQDFLVRQVVHTAGVIDTDLVDNLASLERADTVNVGERDQNALVGGDIYPGNTSHLILHAPQDATQGQRPISTLHFGKNGKKSGWRAHTLSPARLTPFLSSEARA